MLVVFLKNTRSASGRVYKKGEVIDLPQEKAEKLMEKHIIGDYEKYEWCLKVCMLTKGQALICERVKPCPRF